MADVDQHVYPAEFFDDVDDDHAGTAHLECGYDRDGHHYEHVGTYDLDDPYSDHVFGSVIERLDDGFFDYHGPGPHFGLVVVHRRCR